MLVVRDIVERIRRQEKSNCIHVDVVRQVNQNAKEDRIAVLFNNFFLLLALAIICISSTCSYVN